MMLNKTALKARGWTEGLIKRFLPAPDATAPNPRYAKAAPVQLYAETRVRDVEASPEFLAAKAKAAPRQASARKAAQTKREAAERYVEGLCYEVPRLDRDELIRRACAHYKDRLMDRWIERGPDGSDTAGPGSSPEFLERICVNYLRHARTPYESHLQATRGKVGAGDVRVMLSDKALDAIAEAYEWLAVECARQAAAKARRG